MIVGFNNYKNKYQFKVTGIIHVGAHVGQEYEEYMETFGPVETHWFEPLGDVFESLTSNLSDKPGANLYNFGLGENVEEVEMFVDSGNGGQSSSILKPKKHTEQFPHIKFENSNKKKIKIDRLDNFNISDSNMLVLDTQGFELNVLKGSTKTLEKIDYIFTEFNTIEMYEGCPTLDDIDSVLENFGFQRVETYYTDSNWGDAFYIRKENFKPLLSVIIPAYRFSKYIRQCLESVISQKTNFNFEILIRDDFSNDGTKEILNNIIDNHKNNSIIIRNFTPQRNWGGFKNIQFLLNNSRGKYIAYLDGDDFYVGEGTLQKQVDFLENNLDYSITSTCCFMVDEFGRDLIGDWKFLTPTKYEVDIKDILEKNYIKFGRVFRNIPNIMDGFKELSFIDWAMNFKILLHGKGMCFHFIGGSYRITGTGEMTKLGQSEIEKQNEHVKKVISEMYNTHLQNTKNEDLSESSKQKKEIVIIDCFISDKNVESDLINQIEKIKKQNLDILLISNTIVSTDIQQKVDYFIYDKRNQLFQYEYTNLEEIILKDYVYIDKDWQFTTNIVTNGLQRHGLSVLVNLFNAVKFAKSIGYENFWRVEVDDFFCDESLKFIKSCPDLINSEDKKAILYYNSNNISFHFMFWNIDYFLEKIPQIRNEEDYKNLILKNFDSLNFIIAEEFIWKFLKINGDSDVLVKDGENMSLQFPNTVWNTNMSLSNMSPKYENCPSLIFKMNNKSGLFIFTKNYSNDFKSRKIVVYYSDYTKTIVHETPEFNTWCWNIVSENAYKYEVYENERLLYVEDCSKIKNFVEFP